MRWLWLFSLFFVLSCSVDQRMGGTVVIPPNQDVVVQVVKRHRKGDVCAIYLFPAAVFGMRIDPGDFWLESTGVPNEAVLKAHSSTQDPIEVDWMLVCGSARQ